MLTDPRDSDIGGAIVLGNSKVEREGYLQYDTSTTYHTTDCLASYKAPGIMFTQDGTIS